MISCSLPQLFQYQRHPEKQGLGELNYKLIQFSPKFLHGSFLSAGTEFPTWGWCWMEPPSLFPVGWGTRNPSWTHLGRAKGTSSQLGSVILNKSALFPFCGDAFRASYGLQTKSPLNWGHRELDLTGLEIKRASCAPLLIFANIFQRSWAEEYAGVI